MEATIEISERSVIHGHLGQMYTQIGRGMDSRIKRKLPIIGSEMEGRFDSRISEKGAELHPVVRSAVWQKIVALKEEVEKLNGKLKVSRDVLKNIHRTYDESKYGCIEPSVEAVHGYIMWWAWYWLHG